MINKEKEEDELKEDLNEHVLRNSNFSRCSATFSFIKQVQVVIFFVNDRSPALSFWVCGRTGCGGKLIT